MKCDCGYVIDSIGHGKESYALVRDSEYPSFLRREMTAVDKERDEMRHVSLLCESADYVGVIQECPKCATWIVLMPGSSERRVYRRIDQEPKAEQIADGNSVKPSGDERTP